MSYSVLVEVDRFSVIPSQNGIVIQGKNYTHKVGTVKVLDRNSCTITLFAGGEVKLKRVGAFLFEGGEYYVIYNNDVYSTTEKIEYKRQLSFPLQPFDRRHKLLNGDNLIGLQTLNFYQGEIDCIIIDPPYNTGNKAMKYNDVFNVDNRHKTWVEFMKTRLKVAYTLLSQDGLIFINIDDNEYPYLKTLCDEIFDEDNFVENFIWQKNSIKNNSKTTSSNHEYILCFAKDKEKVKQLNYFRQPKQGLSELYQFFEQEKVKLVKQKKQNIDLASELQKSIRAFYSKNKTLKGISQYKFVDENLNIYRISDVSAPNKNGERFEVFHPITKKVCALPAGGYRYKKTTFEQLLKEGRIHFGIDEKTVPQYKRYLSEVEQEVAKSIIVNFDEGYNDLKKILPKVDFNNPKPVSLIRTLLQYINKEQFFVLDFFAGSGTIAQAVAEENAQSHKNITCLAITSNENNICEEITKQRFHKVFKDFDYALLVC